MYFSLKLVLPIFIFSTIGICQTKIEKCPANPDKLYAYQEVNKKIANILNDSIPQYKEFNPNGFYVNETGKGIGFDIFDLVDTSNKETKLNDCVKYLNNHIYHVFSPTYDYSFSHIVVLEKGNLKIFRSINCQNSSDKIEDVLNYLNKKLKNDKDKDEILLRVKNYRTYGEYFQTDNFSTLRCEEIKSP